MATVVPYSNCLNSLKLPHSKHKASAVFQYALITALTDHHLLSSYYTGMLPPS